MQDEPWRYELESGELHPFKVKAWNESPVPSTAGVYTIFERERFIYVGMAGKKIKKTPETTDLDAPTDVAAPDEPRKPNGGLRGRLGSHWGGRRSGDQFSVYVCDRFILPDLSLEDLKAVGEDRLSLDERTREYIRNRFGYRYVETGDGDTALAIELEVQGGALSIGKPFLNPR
jgi:hypothetical protein